MEDRDTPCGARASAAPIVGVARIFDAVSLDAVRPQDSTQIGLERPARGLRFERR
jgi:hypothetical protein